VAVKGGKITAGLAKGTADAALALFKSEDGQPLTAGFVTFNKLQAVHAAQQMVHYGEPFAMEVMEAPGYDDIFWLNVGRTHKQLQVGKLIRYEGTSQNKTERCDCL
jgi:hypothetical protein